MGGRTTDTVKSLILANAIVFLIQQIVFGRMSTLPAGLNPLVRFFGLVPQHTWSRFYIWQFFSYMFLHGNLFHIFFNMYALWVFGCEVERMWGSRAFLRYYFITGVGAGLFHTLLTPTSQVVTIGASGAVMGVLTAYAVMFPNRELNLLLFFIFPVRMRARTLALGFAAISILNGVLGSPDGVAHFAHLGGMLVGYLYMKRDWRGVAVMKKIKQWKSHRKMKVRRKNQEEMEKLRRLVDQVLDKANEVGMENLSRDEKVFLRKASKILKKNGM
jgi:membrane associated rhomboid family serine protease